MTIYTYINTNIDLIKQEMRIGLVPCSVLRHWEIYCRYDYYRKLRNPVGLAVIFTSEDFRVKEDCVYKIKRKMESEI